MRGSHCGTLLGTRIPLGVALELALTGDSIDARRAYALGLVNLVGVVILARLSADGFASLWCFYAAVASGAIALHMRFSRHPDAELAPVQ